MDPDCEDAANESKFPDCAGKELRGARRKAGLTQEQLAERLSISDRALRDLELGKSKASKPTQINIYRELGIEPYGVLEDTYKYPSQKADGVEEIVEPNEEVESLELKIPPPSENNPFVIMCNICGEDEYLNEPICRCNAQLANQVQDQYSNWAVVERLSVTLRARKLGRLSTIGFSGVFIVFGAFSGLGLWSQTSAHVGANLEAYAVCLFLSIAGLSVFYAQLDRRKVRLEKYAMNLSFDDFVRSPHFRTLRRSGQQK